MFFSTAKEIWENLSHTYSMKKDIAASYEIENKVFNTKQGGLFRVMSLNVLSLFMFMVPIGES